MSPIQRVPQFPDAVALRPQAVTDDQCRGLDRCDDVQPYTGHHEAHGKTGNAGCQPAEKCRQEKKSEDHAIHRSFRPIRARYPTIGDACKSSFLGAAAEKLMRSVGGRRPAPARTIPANASMPQRQQPLQRFGGGEEGSIDIGTKLGDDELGSTLLDYRPVNLEQRSAFFDSEINVGDQSVHAERSIILIRHLDIDRARRAED